MAFVNLIDRETAKKPPPRVRGGGKQKKTGGGGGGGGGGSRKPPGNRAKTAHYRCSIGKVSRGAGQSAVAHAAYRAGERLTDELTGEVKDFSRRYGVESQGILAPDNAPDWATDRQKLWNEVERSERRKDARLAKEFTLSIPWQLETPEERQEVVAFFVQHHLVARGMVCDIAIHKPTQEEIDQGNPNYHAHIMATTREIGPNGFGAKCREWNDYELLFEIREAWADTLNLYLAGHDVEVDHRSLADRHAEAVKAYEDNQHQPDAALYEAHVVELSYTPERKFNHAAHAYEKRTGKTTADGDRVREARADRAELEAAADEIRRCYHEKVLADERAEQERLAEQQHQIKQERLAEQQRQVEQERLAEQQRQTEQQVLEQLAKMLTEGRAEDARRDELDRLYQERAAGRQINLNADQTAAIKAAIGNRQWSVQHRNADWIGHPIAEALGLDPDLDPKNGYSPGNQADWRLIQGIMFDHKQSILANSCHDFDYQPGTVKHATSRSPRPEPEPQPKPEPPGPEPGDDMSR